ncbi:MAG: hypothetical protein H7838_13890 [Magnetococcus sp. DMHC-8]
MKPPPLPAAGTAAAPAVIDPASHPTPVSRRLFLGQVVTGGAGVLGLTATAAAPVRQAPVELPLREADFYASHPLAG